MASVSGEADKNKRSIGAYYSAGQANPVGKKSGGVVYILQTMEDFAPKFTSKATTSSAKFNLYLKARELKEISSILEGVIALPQPERDDWVKENGELLSEAIDLFVQDSNLALEEVAMDNESLELSKELVVSLRDTMNIIQGILFDQHKLAS
jgi:hypothetical protein